MRHDVYLSEMPLKHNLREYRSIFVFVIGSEPLTSIHG